MITYITAFIFYTLAMVGILLVGFVVYKKFNLGQMPNSKSQIKVLDRCSIAPKKSLLVVKVKDEKFLLALDCERTTFLAKLESKNSNNIEEQDLKNIQKNFNFQEQRKENIARLFESLNNENPSKRVQNEIKITQPKSEITINDISSRKEEIKEETPQTPKTGQDELQIARAQKFEKMRKMKKLQELQKQFMELYNEKDIQENIQSFQNSKEAPTSQNRKILNRILEELNLEQNKNDVRSQRGIY